MTLRGHVKNGAILLDEPVVLPDGTLVDVIITQNKVPSQERTAHGLGQKLLKHAGKAAGLSEDAALQHDHYLYGTAKR